MALRGIYKNPGIVDNPVDAKGNTKTATGQDKVSTKDLIQF